MVEVKILLCRYMWLHASNFVKCTYCCFVYLKKKKKKKPHATVAFLSCIDFSISSDNTLSLKL